MQYLRTEEASRLAAHERAPKLPKVRAGVPLHGRKGQSARPETKITRNRRASGQLEAVLSGRRIVTRP